MRAAAYGEHRPLHRLPDDTGAGIGSADGIIRAVRACARRDSKEYPARGGAVKSLDAGTGEPSSISRTHANPRHRARAGEHFEVWT